MTSVGVFEATAAGLALVRVMPGVDVARRARDSAVYVSDASAFTESREGQIIAIDREGTQMLVTRSGFLAGPWVVAVVPEPAGDRALLVAAGALTALVYRAQSSRRWVPTASRGGRVRERRVQPRAATLSPTRSITARQSPSARSLSLRV